MNVSWHRTIAIITRSATTSWVLSTVLAAMVMLEMELFVKVQQLALICTYMIQYSSFLAI